jgi:hypothetical protein
MRILAQTADLYRAAGSSARLLVVAEFQLVLAELDHGIEGQSFQPLTLDAQPFAPGLFSDGDVGQQAVPVEADRRFAPQKLLLRSLALASLDRACRNHRPGVSATLTTVAFDHSGLRWLEIGS